MYDEREDEFNEETIPSNEEIIQEETEEIIDSEEAVESDEITEEEAVESDETTEEDSDEEEDGESLPFAKAEVVRLMKQNLDRDKMIRERVKVEMNKFLGEVLEKVCEQLNEYPYTTIEYEMLKESIYPYQNIERINEEKKRILMHLHAIKADCDALSMDVKKTLKLKDVNEEEEDPAFMDY